MWLSRQTIVFNTPTLTAVSKALPRLLSGETLNTPLRDSTGVNMQGVIDLLIYE